MKTIEDVIQFLEEYVIECEPYRGCGKCDATRECVEILKSYSEEFNKNLTHIIDK